MLLVHVQSNTLGAPCYGSPAGATVTVTGADGGTFPVAYFTLNKLSTTATTVQDTSRYSAVAYNIDPSAEVQVSITPGGADAGSACHQVPFPASEQTTRGTITFAGTVQVPAAPQLAFLPTWIE